MKINQVGIGVKKSVTGRSEVEFGVGESPKVMEEGGAVRVVGLGCLPRHPALDKEMLVVV